MSKKKFSSRFSKISGPQLTWIFISFILPIQIKCCATILSVAKSLPYGLFLGYRIQLERNSGDDKTDEEMEGTHSEDEMFAQRGLRRSQSMKSVKSIKGRKEASALAH